MTGNPIRLTNHSLWNKWVCIWRLVRHANLKILFPFSSSTTLNLHNEFLKCRLIWSVTNHEYMILYPCWCNLVRVHNIAIRLLSRFYWSHYCTFLFSLNKSYKPSCTFLLLPLCHYYDDTHQILRHFDIYSPSCIFCDVYLRQYSLVAKIIEAQ